MEDLNELRQKFWEDIEIDNTSISLGIEDEEEGEE